VIYLNKSGIRDDMNGRFFKNIAAAVLLIVALAAFVFLLDADLDPTTLVVPATETAKPNPTATQLNIEQTSEQIRLEMCPFINAPPGTSELDLDQMDEQAKSEANPMAWPCVMNWTWTRWLSEPSCRPMR
jgi:hypothetical protein